MSASHYGRVAAIKKGVEPPPRSPGSPTGRLGLPPRVPQTQAQIALRRAQKRTRRRSAAAKTANAKSRAMMMRTLSGGRTDAGAGGWGMAADASESAGTGAQGRSGLPNARRARGRTRRARPCARSARAARGPRRASRSRAA